MKSYHMTVKALHSHATIALVDTQSYWIDENLKMSVEILRLLLRSQSLVSFQFSTAVVGQLVV